MQRRKFMMTAASAVSGSLTVLSYLAGMMGSPVAAAATQVKLPARRRGKNKQALPYTEDRRSYQWQVRDSVGGESPGRTEKLTIVSTSRSVADGLRVSILNYNREAIPDAGIFYRNTDGEPLLALEKIETYYLPARKPLPDGFCDVAMYERSHGKDEAVAAIDRLMSGAEVGQFLGYSKNNDEVWLSMVVLRAQVFHWDYPELNHADEIRGIKSDNIFMGIDDAPGPDETKLFCQMFCDADSVRGVSLR